MLEGHHAHAGQSEDDRRFLVLHVRHSARNNFNEDLRQAIAQALDGDDSQRHGNAAAEVPSYRNRFTAIRAATAYRPLLRDGHGALLHPKPTVHGWEGAGQRLQPSSALPVRC